MHSLSDGKGGPAAADEARLVGTIPARASVFIHPPSLAESLNGHLKLLTSKMNF
jgi:hypothetical protein